MTAPPDRNGEHTPIEHLIAANVSQVSQLSPLRYPGGKTGLIPHVRKWLEQIQPTLLVEPFAGGGIVSLTAVKEDLVERCVMIELDPDVAAFWHAVLQEGEELACRIESFSLDPEQVEKVIQTVPVTQLEHGFRTLVLNRTRRAGILAPGAALIRQGESGQGLRSRWYPDTLVQRIRDIQSYADRIAFCQGDAMQLLPDLLHGWGQRAALFVDPPYSASGTSAGQRLYTCHDLDHECLFRLLARRRNPFLMTYDATPEIKALVAQHKFHSVPVRMKNAHHETRTELVITAEPWLP